MSSVIAATTDSLVGKYRLKVRGDTSAAAAICSTVVLSKPCSHAQLGRRVDQRRPGPSFLAFPQAVTQTWFSHAPRS